VLVFAIGAEWIGAQIRRRSDAEPLRVPGLTPSGEPKVG
jgi:hypothetical protein